MYRTFVNISNTLYMGNILVTDSEIIKYQYGLPVSSDTPGAYLSLKSLLFIFRLPVDLAARVIARRCWGLRMRRRPDRSRLSSDWRSVARVRKLLTVDQGWPISWATCIMLAKQ